MKQVKAFKFLLFFALFASVLLNLGHAQTLPKVSKNRLDVYYTDNVTRATATKLLNYLIAEEFSVGDRDMACQLDRTGNTYEFKFNVKKGLDTDPDAIKTAKQMAKEMSDAIFDGAPTDIHFMDDDFKLLRVIVVL